MNTNSNWYAYGALALLLVIIIGIWLFGTHGSINGSFSQTEYNNALTLCGAYPNGSTQIIGETSRLSIQLPKKFYPNQTGFLAFTTATGTATAGWISNAGPIGNSNGATVDCFAYYYEFDGKGDVDLLATSSLNGVPNYTLRFIVNSNSTPSTVTYHNETYRFTFSLPDDWKGYTSVNSSWTGYTACSTGQCPSQTGPEILIRNPNWTATHPWQDIPIMIFTHGEWNRVTSNSLVVSAAPILPMKLGENSSYVFALPPRYNYAFPEGWQEVETIIKNNPLKTF